MKRRLNKAQYKWIAELKSGKTKKHEGELANGHGGFCCLGVAAKLHGLKTCNLKGEDDLEDFQEVKRSLLLRSEVGDFDIMKVSKTLSTYTNKGRVDVNCLALMNDHGWTHVEIGKFIDENRDAVFLPSKKKSRIF